MHCVHVLSLPQPGRIRGCAYVCIVHMYALCACALSSSTWTHQRLTQCMHSPLVHAFNAVIGLCVVCGAGTHVAARTTRGSRAWGTRGAYLLSHLSHPSHLSSPLSPLSPLFTSLTSLTSLRLSPLDATRLNSTRRDATRLDSTRLDVTRLDATQLDSTRRDSTRLSWTRLDSTGLDSTAARTPYVYEHV